MKKDAGKIAFIICSSGFTGVTIGHYAELWGLAYAVILAFTLFTWLIFEVTGND